MDNITGKAVADKNFLSSRLYLVEELRSLVRKTSVIIDAPRRFGKTSVVKELMFEEKKKLDNEREFNILFFELEGEETINSFCFTFFKELLKLYSIRGKIDMLSDLLGDLWNAIAGRIGKIKLPQFELELREKTRSYDLSRWKERIEPMIRGLNSFERRTVIVFDEFPDMLLNFRVKGAEPCGYLQATDRITAWLRELRQKSDDEVKYQFVFCGSVNLRKTLQEMGIGKRINDLEPLRIPLMKTKESLLLIKNLMRKYDIEIKQEAIDFMVTKINDGSPYYGQILFKALIDARERRFSLEQIKAIYDAMLRGGDHDLNHFHSRLQDYLVSAAERECAAIILKHLCDGPLQEKILYDGYMLNICSNKVFQAVLNRLIYEGYIMRDTKDEGKVRFVSPLLKDWWACKEGLL
jgi:uncharacterized protein